MIDTTELADELRTMADRLENNDEDEEYPETVDDFDAKVVLDDSYVTVYEDRDGDYWIEHCHDHEDEKPILVTQPNRLHTVLEDEVGQ